MGDRIGAYRVLVEKPEGRRPLGRPRHRWECNTKTSVIERHRLDLSGSGERQVAGACECRNGIVVAIKYREYPELLRIS
jgi:hypothetical protein